MNVGSPGFDAEPSPVVEGRSGTRTTRRAIASSPLEIVRFGGGRAGIRVGGSVTMAAFRAAIPVLILLTALAVWDPPWIVQAQEAYDPEGTVYATGLIPATEEELADVPRTPLYRNYLPPSVDLSDRFPPAGQQGDQGSCVAWAVGYAARSYYNSGPDGGSRLTVHDVPSPAYIFNTIRKPRPNCEGGSRIIDAMELLRNGAVSLAEFPYDEGRCQRPSAGTAARATKFRIHDWQVVNTKRLDQVKGELAGGHPVVIGMRPNNDFYGLRGRKVWRAGYPEDGDGNHAITVVGYSEPGQYFTIINSWGRRWGERGFARIFYDTFRKRVKYGYSMRLAAEPKPEPPKPKPEPPKPKPEPPKPKPEPPKPKPEPPKPKPEPPKPKPEPPKPKPEPPKPKPEPPTPVVPELVLPEIGCGRIAIEKRGGEQVVVGFVGTQEDLAKIQEAASKAETRVRVEVALRPWPQCEALMTIENPLAQASKPAISLPRSSYRAEETLAFDVAMADFQGYLHLAYIQADGNVVNLVESDALTLSTLPAQTQLTFGDGLEGRPKFTVSAPFGNEMIVALASKSPLFADDRPLVETEREFLTALRKAIIARPDPTQPERVVSASFVTLETKPGE